jgi:cytochrome oxidase Cu insertion factor (SCO1/SenC/PrrC family)
MRRLVVTAGALALAIGAVTAVVVWRRTTDARSEQIEQVNGPPSGPYRGSEPPARILLPHFTLRDERGRTLDSDDLRDKVVLLTFLDSQCTDSCPIIAFTLARTLERLRPDERSHVEAVAITTDPTEDTPAAIETFLAKQRATGKVRYIGGGQSLQRLRVVWRSFEILASFQTGEDSLHSAPVRVYDREGVWVATQHAGADLTTRNLVHDVRVALSRS